MKRIVIEVSDEGELKIETKGFVGKACIEETEFLKELLGKEVHQQLTAAFYSDKANTKKYLTLCG